MRRKIKGVDAASKKRKNSIFTFVFFAANMYIHNNIVQCQVVVRNADAVCGVNFTDV